MITIAVDAMGGDNAPRPEVEGSVLAARELGVRVLLVGQQTVIRAELAKHAPANLPIEIVPASEVIIRWIPIPPAAGVEASSRKARGEICVCVLRIPGATGRHRSDE